MRIKLIYNEPTQEQDDLLLDKIYNMMLNTGWQVLDELESGLPIPTKRPKKPIKP